MNFLKNLYFKVRDFIAFNVARTIHACTKLSLTSLKKRMKNEEVTFNDKVKTVLGNVLGFLTFVTIYASSCAIAYGIGYAFGFVLGSLLGSAGAILAVIVAPVVAVAVIFDLVYNIIKFEKVVRAVEQTEEVLARFTAPVAA